MQPQLGIYVHYRSYGTPGGEHPGTCRTALVTEVGQWLTVGTEWINPHDPPEPGDRRNVEQVWDPDALAVMVANPTGVFFNAGCRHDEGAETSGLPDCLNSEAHGDPFRYCACGWAEASRKGGTWHWPEELVVDASALGESAGTRIPAGREE